MTVPTNKSTGSISLFTNEKCVFSPLIVPIPTLGRREYEYLTVNENQ